MQSESLGRVRPVTVLLGWFIGAALTSLAVFALIALGLLGREGSGSSWGLLVIAVGFGVAGWWIGRSGGGAPVLYAAAMGLVSLLVWLLSNLIPGALVHAQSWSAGAGYTAGLLLLQMAASALGGYLAARRPAPPQS